MNRSNLFVQALSWLVCLGVLGGSQRVILAGNLPIQKFVAKSGKKVAWNVNVEPPTSSGNAFGSLRFLASLPTGVATRERTLRVELYTNAFNSNEYDEHITYYLKVAEGNAGISETLEFPLRQHLNSIFLRIYEDGEFLAEQRIATASPNPNGYFSTDDYISILTIDSDMVTASTRDSWRGRYDKPGSPFANQKKLPDLRAFLAVFPDNWPVANYPGNTNDAARLDDAATLLFSESPQSASDYMHPQELNSRWLGLSQENFIFITRNDLLDLQKKQAESFEAIVRWCMAGGTLIIYDAAEPSFPQELDQLLAANSPSLEVKHAWRKPHARDFSSLLMKVNYGGRDNNHNLWLYATGEDLAEDKKLTPDEMQNMEYLPANPQQQPNNPNAATIPPKPNVRRVRTKVKPPADSPFVFRSLGFGNVVIWKEADPFPGKIEHWGWMLNSIEAHKLSWPRQHGMTHNSENNGYWNFLIPGIGQAPVFMFMGMIGIFMLVIGPLNYYVLGRMKRVSLLLVTVPVGAFIFTLGLVLFAILSDGFSSQARVRSYTELADGHAVSMSRQTYFAAFVPSAGLTFPRDTAVYPLHFRPWEYATGYDQYYYHTDSEWSNGVLTLRGRYLGSREQRQFMVVRSTTCAARLEVKELPPLVEEGKTAPTKLRITNRLGVPIELGLLRGSQGEFYILESLASDATVELAPLTEKELARNKPNYKPWSDKLSVDSLDQPRYYASNQQSMLTRSYRVQRYQGRSFTNTSTSESALELGRIAAYNASLAAVTDANNNPVSFNRQYFVITPTPVIAEDGDSLVPVGLPAAQIVQQSHVTHGSW